MSEPRSIKYNFIMNSLLMGTAFILPFLITPYVSRVLMPEGMGKISFATSIMTYFNMLAMLGVPTYGIRACAKVRDNKEKLSDTVKSILCINIVMAVISYIALFICINMFSKFQEEKKLLYAMSIMIFLSVSSLDWLYKGLEEYKVIAIRAVIIKVVLFVLTFLLVRTKSDLVLYGIITVISLYGAGLWNLIGARKYISFKGTKKLQITEHIKPISLFFFMSIATVIYTNLDIVMLGFMTTDVQMGYYDAAVKMKTLLTAVVASLGTVILPRVSYFVAHGMKKEFENLSKRALNCIFLLGVPLVVYFSIFAKPTILLLSGEMYSDAVTPMKIIMPTVLLIGITNITGIQMLVPLGKEKWVLYSEIVGAVVDVVINAILIPKYAAAGAALGTLVAEVVVLLIQLIGVRRYAKSIFANVQYWKIIISVGCATLPSMWLLNSDVSGVTKLFFSAILFFGTYLVMLLVCREREVMVNHLQIINKIKKRGK